MKYFIGKLKKKYIIESIKIGWFKIELITYKDKFNFRFEISKGWDK